MQPQLSGCVRNKNYFLPCVVIIKQKISKNSVEVVRQYCNMEKRNPKISQCLCEFCPLFTNKEKIAIRWFVTQDQHDMAACCNFSTI